MAFWNRIINWFRDLSARDRLINDLKLNYKMKRFFNILFGKSKRDKIRDSILNEDIDFSNVVSSSLLAKRLYDELKTICHPDRFKDERDKERANELSQLVNQNKGNYNTLIFLKERIYNELPINKNN